MFTEEMSLRDIRAKALTQALHAAVSEALGRRLTAVTEVATLENNDGVSETFSEIVREA
jgi:AAA+ superfamily predicted ATPase